MKQDLIKTKSPKKKFTELFDNLQRLVWAAFFATMGLVVIFTAYNNAKVNDTVGLACAILFTLGCFFISGALLVTKGKV